MDKKHKLFFADLNYIKKDKQWTIIPFPLNVAYIASYVQKMLPDTFEIKIFKDPEKLLHSIQNEKPQVVAFSNYIWNKNLQLEFARYLKKNHPDCITVMGGPNYNFTELEWVENFARENPQIDFHIEGEGEIKNFNLIKSALENDFDPTKTKLAKPDGVCFINPKTDDMVFDTISRVNDLNDIPSPYLNGILDEFLKDENFCPIVETNRGCPYLCTFCNWGDMGKSKSSSFSTERVFAEFEYIAKNNVSKTPYLYLGDANFGLFNRDIEFAKKLREYKDEYGFPQNIYLYFEKNSKESVLKIAEIIKDMTNFSLSRQTQNEEVLKNIKRQNISIDLFNKLSTLAKNLGVQTFVELIYGLPGESLKSFYDGVRSVMKQNVDGLHFFPAMLLNGSEMGTKNSRKKFDLSGEFRLIDGCSGTFGPINAIEFEEIITKTKVMTRDEYFEIRVFHFFQNLFIDLKIYKDLEVLLDKIEFIDLIFDIISNLKDAPPLIQNLISNFIEKAKSEFWSNVPKIINKEHVDLANNMNLGKLNPVFTTKLLYDPGVRDAFHEFLQQRLTKICQAKESDIKIILKQIDDRIFPFDGNSTKIITTNFDIYAFSKRSLNQTVNIEQFFLKTPKTFQYKKRNTFKEFIDKMQDMQLSQKVYEIMQHHSHQEPRETLLFEYIDVLDKNSIDHKKVLVNEDKGTRKIRLEGGWVG
jgi:radical SAM superfamily enzyme YgiQ (UPF0313 family)